PCERPCAAQQRQRCPWRSTVAYPFSQLFVILPWLARSAHQRHDILLQLFIHMDFGASLARSKELLLGTNGHRTLWRSSSPPGFVVIKNFPLFFGSGVA